MSFFEELKRRNVFRVGIAYVISAWVLLQFIDLVLENIQAPDWVMKVFMLALAIGFPLAVIFAWAFEMTPEGIRKEKDVDRSKSITTKTGRKLDFTIIGVMAVALLWFTWDKFGNDPQNTSPVTTEQSIADDSTITTGAAARSVAVLPFVNMSSDPEQEYFSDGISEEILNVLARIPELKVAARTSAFAYKGTNINVAEIAKELKVDHVLEGSVRKSGNQVRITAQLIKADDGYHLWSETFDRELTNIFAIQDEIATSIADALKVTLELKENTAGNLTGTASTEAYDAYLRGVNQWHLRTAESLNNSIELFEEAIALDPDFAKAYAGLALTWAVIMDYDDVEPKIAQANAGKAAATALELNPDSVEAATALIYSTDDILQQLEYSRQALTISDSFATTHQWYATSLSLVGDMDAALREYLLAFELDPRSRVIGMNLALQYLMLGQKEASERILHQVSSFAPDYTNAKSLLFLHKLMFSDRTAAESAGLDAMRTLGRTTNFVNVYLDLVFEPSKRDAAIETILNWPRDDWWAPENPDMLGYNYYIELLASVGAMEQARAVLRDQIATLPAYSYGSYRTARHILEFVCDAEVQEIFAVTTLPPLVVPFPCEELLK